MQSQATHARRAGEGQGWVPYLRLSEVGEAVADLADEFAG
jgi:hypothetical protein